jgi:beta-phosphoglucomutase-like phosphatase (HAD superfamily)
MKAIIFDVDGVLLKNKDEHGKHLWQKNIATDLGLNHDQMRQIYAKDWFLVIRGLVDTRQHFKTVFKLRGFNSPRLASQSAKRSYYGT